MTKITYEQTRNTPLFVQTHCRNCDHGTTVMRPSGIMETYCRHFFRWVTDKHGTARIWDCDSHSPRLPVIEQMILTEIFEEPDDE